MGINVFVFDLNIMCLNKCIYRYLCIKMLCLFFYFDFIYRILVVMVICFREKVFLCRVYLRDYIGVYNLIFGGKCIVFF